LATSPLDAKMVAAIKAGQKASASYVLGSKQLMQVDLDLKSFGEAYDYLVQQIS
jgi:invasion protein IalB